MPWKIPSCARVIATLGLFVIVTAPQAAAQTIMPGRAPLGTAQTGAEMFAATCTVCHGPAGEGAVGPRLRGPRFTGEFVKSVVEAGRPGTMMPRFAQRLTPEEISLIASYVASLQGGSSNGEAVPRRDLLVGNPVAGEAAFFNRSRAYSCHACHSVNGRGGRVGPDLARKVATLPAREVFEKIVRLPHRSPDPAYATFRLTTKIEILVGIKASEDENVVRFYDTRYLPPLLRIIKKSDVVSLTPLREPVMPSDYASRLSLKELLDLVAFLKATTGPQPPVRLEDVDAAPPPG